jgi:prolyl-tRNA synthetase
MYKCQEGEKEIGLGPTHEEMVTDIIRRYVKSYDDLPVSVFQIQTKFRKELRARSGLLRGREFLMKDLYSFHRSEEDFRKYYQEVARAYFKIFERCGLHAILTEASGAGFTKEYTHEFQVLSPGGEDTIIYCPREDFSQNKEIAQFKAGDKCPKCKSVLKEAESIEVGNIFPLGTKYSKAMNALFADEKGIKKPIIMGCYGIGVSRVMGAVAEVHHDEQGIIWPKEITPFKIHLIQIENTPNVEKTAVKLYKDLLKTKTEVLYDDRKEKSAGEKFADADLIGMPYRLVVSEKTLAKGSVELKKREEKTVKLIKINKVLSFKYA